FAKWQPAKLCAGQISGDSAERRPDQVGVDVVGFRDPPGDIVLREVHPRAEKAAGEHDEQDPRQCTDASRNGEAAEKAERQVQEYVCNEVTAARRLDPTLREVLKGADAAFGLTECKRVERTVEDDGDDERRRNQKTPVEPVFVPGNQGPKYAAGYSIGSPECT